MKLFICMENEVFENLTGINTLSKNLEGVYYTSSIDFIEAMMNLDAISISCRTNRARRAENQLYRRTSFTSDNVDITEFFYNDYWAEVIEFKVYENEGWMLGTVPIMGPMGCGDFTPYDWRGDIVIGQYINNEFIPTRKLEQYDFKYRR